MPKHRHRRDSLPANRWMITGKLTGQVWEVIVNLHCSRFSDTQSIDAIRSKAESLPHIQGGTRTDRALELAAEDFFGWEDSGDRPDKPNVLIVLTDGNTNEGSKPFSQVTPPLDVSNCWQTIIASFIVFYSDCCFQLMPQVLAHQNPWQSNTKRENPSPQ